MFFCGLVTSTRIDKMIGEIPVLVVAVVVALSTVSVTGATSSGEDHYEGPLLSTFTGIHRELIQHPDGTYTFSFSLPQQDRYENRDIDGKVTGSFSFVDDVGGEVLVKYDADEQGFRPESDVLPEVPEDTDDVQNAREQFLRFYEQTVKYLEELGSDEDDSSSSSEESDEYDYEDDDDDDDDSDDSSSEEDSDEEESDEEDSDEEDDDEEGAEEEEEEDIHNDFFRYTPQRKFSRGFGSRVRQQDLSRSASAKETTQTQTRAVFPPVLAAPVFGRRTSSRRQ